MFYLFEPMPHQREIVSKSAHWHNLAMFWWMGSGKTFAAINILRMEYAKHNTILPTVIFTPLVTLYNWKDEFKKFSKIDPAEILVVNKNGKARLKMVENHIKYNKNIIIVNWEALQTVDFMNLLYEWKPDVIVGDELHYLKNYKSKRAKIAVRFADKMRETTKARCIGLTGTPILNSVEDIYMQYRFLDGGKTFGKNFFVFRNRYMYDENSGWSSKPGYFPKYVPRPEMFDELNTKMYSMATRVTREQALPDLPPLVRQVRHVPMSPEQSKLYKEMKRDFITFVKDNSDKPKAVVAQLAMTKALRLQQILTGFVSTEDGTIIEVQKNPRLDYTKELLERICKDDKVIVWCAFKQNYKQVSKVCKELDLRHVFINGDMTLDQKRDAMESFRTDPKCKVVIAHRKAGGIGINLVEAAYSIVYSRDFSLGNELQSEARNYRKGSEIHEKIVKIDLTCKDTIDELVTSSLNCKQKLSEIILDKTLEEL